MGFTGRAAYGPDLAGLGLTFEQFTRQIRQPWGAMPRWSERQLPDQAARRPLCVFHEPAARGEARRRASGSTS